MAALSRNPGKQAFLPPKSPFPSLGIPVYADYSSAGARGAPKLRESSKYHQRTSSESFLIEEQPSWLDDLLNEPETPAHARRGVHRRSSSDSFAYLEGSYVHSNMDNLAQGECRGRTLTSMPLWGSQEFDQLTDLQHRSVGNSFNRTLYDSHLNSVWESTINMGSNPKGVPLAKEKYMPRGPLAIVSKEHESAVSYAIQNQEKDDFLKDSTDDLEKKDASQIKHFQSESDVKRVKQQFAHRSRVRKLQYIAELESSVQALQAEQMDASAELKFLDQQNLILNLENKALKQRLDSLAQEHLVKCLQQEMLEREIARLRSLLQHQQQQLPQEVAPSRGRSSGRDIDSHFAHLSIKNSEGNSGRDPATGLRM